MYTKILVPLDGSKVAEGILPYVRSLVRALKVPVELLTAIDPEIIRTFTDPTHGRYVDVIEADMKRDSLAYLKQVARSFPDPSAVAGCVEIGKPAQTIVDRASPPGTLIAMSTHGRTGVRRWVMGSVADKVLHATKNHLLLVRPNSKSNPDNEAALKTIILPLDGSSMAEKPFPHVISLAKALDVTVLLLRAYTLPVSAYYGSEAYSTNMEAITGMVRSEGKIYLEDKQEQLRDEGVDKVSFVLLQGDPSAEIIDCASETPASLVAMCTHGRSGIERWVLGSVTDRVVRHSGNPVLIIQAGSK